MEIGPVCVESTLLTCGESDFTLKEQISHVDGIQQPLDPLELTAAR